MNEMKKNQRKKNSLSFGEGRGEADNWISDVMGSVDGIKPAEVNPFLFEKVLTRMQTSNQREAFFTKRMVLRLSAGFVLLLILNLVSIKQYRSGNHRHENQTSSFNEYDFSYNYNY